MRGTQHNVSANKLNIAKWGGGGGEEVRWKTVRTYGKILATPLYWPECYGNKHEKYSPFFCSQYAIQSPSTINVWGFYQMQRLNQRITLKSPWHKIFVTGCKQNKKIVYRAAVFSETKLIVVNVCLACKPSVIDR